MQSTLRYFNELGARIGKRSAELAALCLIIGIAFALNLWLVAEDHRPPPWDYATYLSKSLEFYNAVRLGSLGRFFKAFNDPFRPPILPLMTLPFYAIVDTSYRSAMLANLVFIVVLVVSTYKLGEILNSSKLGLVAAAIVVSAPGIFTYTRVFNLDFPLASLVAATSYAVLGSNGFSSRRMSVLSGVLFAVGMLIKWSFFVFVAPLVLAEVIQHGRRTSISNLIIGSIVCALVASTWYVGAIAHGLVRKIAFYAWGPEARFYSPTKSLYELSAVLYYPRVTFNYILGPFYSITLIAVALLSAVVLMLFCKPTRQSLRAPRVHTLWSLAVALACATLAFTILVDKAPRFYLPSITFAVLLIVSAGWRLHRRFGPLLLIAIAVSGTVATTVGALQPAIGVRLGLYEPGTLTDKSVGYSEYSPPKSNDWKVDSIVKLIAGINPEARVAMLTDHWVFNSDTLRYYAVRLGFAGLSFFNYRDTELQGIDGYSLLWTFSFVLEKTGDIGQDWNTYTAKGVLQRLSNQSDPFYTSWKEITSFGLPDGSFLIVFMKTPRTNQAPSFSVQMPQADTASLLYDGNSCRIMVCSTFDTSPSIAP